MITLGLDVSTSKTGWCLLSDDGSLIRMGCVDLSSQNDLFMKTEFLMVSLVEEVGEINGELAIVIEEPLLRFARGMSSASTLLTLNRFNGMVTYACWKEIGVKPTHLNVIFARRSLGIKRDKERNVKDVVMQWVANDVTTYVWPTKIVTRGKRKGETVFEASCYDVADAYVMAKAIHVRRVKESARP